MSACECDNIFHVILQKKETLAKYLHEDWMINIHEYEIIYFYRLIGKHYLIFINTHYKQQDLFHSR